MIVSCPRSGSNPPDVCFGSFPAIRNTPNSSIRTAGMRPTPAVQMLVSSFDRPAACDPKRTFLGNALRKAAANHGRSPFDTARSSAVISFSSACCSFKCKLPKMVWLRLSCTNVDEIYGSAASADRSTRHPARIGTTCVNRSMRCIGASNRHSVNFLTGLARST